MSTLPTPSVALLGQGVRAAALTRALADHATVTIWDANSGTPWADRAIAAQSVHAAVDSATLILLCTDDAEDTVRLFDHAGPHTTSHDVVNLTPCTESQVRYLADRVGERGGRYLDGALMGHPEHVGNPDTVLVFSGSPQLFHHHLTLLERLGSTTFLGSNPTTATLYETAMLDFAWTTLLGYLHSAALLRTAGIPATTTTPLLTHWMSTTIAPVITDYAHQIDNRRYPGDQEWLELDAPLMANLIRTAADRGVDTQLPRLIESLTRRGINAGHGLDSFASLIDTMTAPSQH